LQSDEYRQHSGMIKEWSFLEILAMSSSSDAAIAIVRTQVNGVTVELFAVGCWRVLPEVL
jgi:hypothetical protein